MTYSVAALRKAMCMELQRIKVHLRLPSGLERSRVYIESTVKLHCMNHLDVIPVALAFLFQMQGYKLH